MLQEIIEGGAGKEKREDQRGQDKVTQTAEHWTQTWKASSNNSNII